MARRRLATKLADAVVSGSRVDALTALRDRLAREIDSCESKRDMAALSLRFMDVVEQLEVLTGGSKSEPKETGLSEFEKRLRERESAPKTARRTSG